MMLTGTIMLDGNVSNFMSEAAIVANRCDSRTVMAVNSFSDKDRRRALRKNLKRFVDVMNVEAENLGLPQFKMGFKEPQFVRRGYVSDLVEKELRGDDTSKARGYCAFDTTANIVLRSMKALFIDKKKLVVIDLTTQFGKTNIINCLAYSIRSYASASGREAQVVIMPYGKQAPTKEAKDDYLASLNIYSDVYFAQNPQLTFGYCSSHLRDLNHDLLTKRTTLKDTETQIKAAKASGCKKVYLLVDEGDFGAGINSILHRIFNAYAAAGIEVIVIVTTATAYEVTAPEAEVITYHVPPGRGYRHIVVGDRLPLVSWTEIGVMTGIDLNPDPIGKTKRELDAVRHGNMSELIHRFSVGIDAPEFGLNGLPMNGGRAIALRCGKNSNDFARHFEQYAQDHSLNFYVARYSLDGELRDEDGQPVTVTELLAKHPDKYVLIVVKNAGRRADRFPAECAIFIDTTPFYSTAEAALQGFAGRASGWNKPNNVCIFSDQNVEAFRLMQTVYDETGVLDPCSFRSARGVRVAPPPVIKEEHRARMTIKSYEDTITIPKSISQKVDAAFAEMVYPFAQFSPNKAGTKKPFAAGFRLSFCKSKQRASEIIRNNGLEDRVKFFEGRLYFDLDALLGGSANVEAIEKLIGQSFRNQVRLKRPGDVHYRTVKKLNGNVEEHEFTLDEFDGFVNIGIGNSNRISSRNSGNRSDTDGKAIAQSNHTTKGKREDKHDHHDFLVDAQMNGDQFKINGVTQMVLLLQNVVTNRSGIANASHRSHVPGKNSTYYGRNYT